MDSYIKELIKNSNSKNFEKFYEYVYMTFEKQICSAKHKKDKNKYIKIRESILRYVVFNERAINLELRKINN